MTKLVGILNLTPDSFSGDGLHNAVDKALARIDAMIEEGASVIDVGAESTRPSATPLTPHQEWERLAPVIEALGNRLHKVAFSIDTRHLQTAQRAMTFGFDWLNDVGGGSDRGMPKLAKDSGCVYVAMHSLTLPADAGHVLPADMDVTQAVIAWGQQLIDRLEDHGIKRSRIILDPGIGFGKTAQQSMKLIRDTSKLKALGVPVMVGHSRKSFLTLLDNDQGDTRDMQTLALSKFLIAEGVDYLRVHDIKSHSALVSDKAFS